MLAVLTCTSGVGATQYNHTYWAYIPNPRLVTWGDTAPRIFTNDSIFMPLPWEDGTPAHLLRKDPCIIFLWNLIYLLYALVKVSSV